MEMILFEPVEMKKNANPQVQFQQILVASPWLSPVQGLVFEDQGVLPHISNSMRLLQCQDQHAVFYNTSI